MFGASIVYQFLVFFCPFPWKLSDLIFQSVVRFQLKLREMASRNLLESRRSRPRFVSCVKNIGSKTKPPATKRHIGFPTPGGGGVGGCDDGGGLGDGGGGVRGDHGRGDRHQTSGGKTSDLFSSCVKPNQIVVDSIHKHKLHCKQKLLLESNATWQLTKPLLCCHFLQLQF